MQMRYTITWPEYTGIPICSVTVYGMFQISLLLHFTPSHKPKVCGQQLPGYDKICYKPAGKLP